MFIKRKKEENKSSVPNSKSRQEKVDEILDKIKLSGYESLTKEEKIIYSMPVSIFNFGVNKMSLRGKLFAYLTIVFNLLLCFSYLAFLSDPTTNTGVAFPD